MVQISAPIRTVAIMGEKFGISYTAPEGYTVKVQHDCPWLGPDLIGIPTLPDGINDQFLSVTFEGTPDDPTKERLVHHCTIIVRRWNTKEVQYTMKVDCAINGSESMASKIQLPEGEYVVIIRDCCGHADQKFGILPVVTYKDGLTHSVARLKMLDYGKYPALEDAREAYIGLSYGIVHDGGEVTAHFNSYLSPDAFGSMELVFQKKDNQPYVIVAYAAVQQCEPKVVVTIDNQDYIIGVVSGNWIAWPTFDLKTPISFGKVEYKCALNRNMSESLKSKILRNSLIKLNANKDQAVEMADKVYFLEL